MTGLLRVASVNGAAFPTIRSLATDNRCRLTGIGKEKSGSSLAVFPVSPEHTARNPCGDAARDQEERKQQLRRRLQYARCSGSAKQEPSEEMAPTRENDDPSSEADALGNRSVPVRRLVPPNSCKGPDNKRGRQDERELREFCQTVVGRNEIRFVEEGPACPVDRSGRNRQPKERLHGEAYQATSERSHGDASAAQVEAQVSDSRFPTTGREMPILKTCSSMARLRPGSRAILIL